MKGCGDTGRERISPVSFRCPWWAWLLMVLTMAACGDRGAYVPPPPAKVTVAQPVQLQVTDYLELTGNTQAINTVQLQARVEGYLEKVLFHDGEQVKKGQLLFLIQQNTYEAKLRQAEADVLTQKARLFHAQTEYTRYSNLLKEKAASQTDVDQWLYERDSARAALMAAQAQLELSKLDLSYTRVTAPFDGRIDRRLRDPGNLVGSGGEKTVLADLNQIDPIYVYFTLNEKDLLRLLGEIRAVSNPASKGKFPVNLGLANEKGYSHRGYLDFSAISVTPTTGTILLRGVFPNPDGAILPGLFARVRISVGQPRASLLVPQAAVAFDQLGNYVLVVNDKNVVERRAVSPGQQMDNWRVIDEGLKGSDWVVVEGMLRAIPGREVSPQKTEAKAPGAPDNAAPPGPKPKASAPQAPKAPKASKAPVKKAKS